MKTTHILIALALLATTLALVPSASASPRTCAGLPTDHALEAYASCAITCAENVAHTEIIYYPDTMQIRIYQQPCPS